MVDNYIIDHKRFLGEGEYGKVYLAQEIPENKCKWKSRNNSMSSGTNESSTFSF